VTHCVRWGPCPPRGREDLGVEPPAKKCSCKLLLPPGEYKRGAILPFAKLLWLLLLCVCFMFRSSDAQLLVVSSTDGYCTLITFDENELGTVYNKCDEVVAPASSPVKPVRQVEERMLEVRTPARKELGVIQTALVTQPSPVSRESSPQRKKARRVVLQTLSTDMAASFTNLPQNTADSGKTEVAQNGPNTEKCNIGSDLQCSGQMDDFSKRTTTTASGHEPESMDVSGDAQAAKVCIH